MAAGALLVFAVTAAAAALGPRLSGLLAPFPVIASSLTAYTHFCDGSRFAFVLATALTLGAHALLIARPWISPAAPTSRRRRAAGSLALDVDEDVRDLMRVSEQLAVVGPDRVGPRPHLWEAS
jgi:hypothetical protein